MELYDEPCIVVTGGAGFIGSAVVRELNDRGHENIVIVDNIGKSEKWKNLVGKRYADVIHKNNLFTWLEGRERDIEAFIHLGACSDTMELDANYLIENNYRYTQILAEYALQNGQRFVYASSASTYGDGSRGFSDDHEGLDELHPLNMYGYSKHMFDLWADREGILNSITGLKYFNVYGPNEYHKGRMASAIVRMLPDIQQKGFISLFKSSEPELFSDGEQKRDFVYVKDVAAITVEFLEDDLATGIYNVGTGIAATWNELAEALFCSLDKKSNITYIPMPEELRGKYQNFTKAEVEKISAKLGERFKITSLKDAVCDYVQNYLLKGARW